MVTIKNVTKIYNPKKSNEFEALHGVSAEIKDGELVAIIGKSGAGKSTLLHILACIDSYQDGEYKIDDTLVKGLSERKYAQIRNEKIGMVMQDFALVEDFTALENVMIPALIGGKSKKTAAEEASRLLSEVGLSERMTHKPTELSGGEQQRVAIARALINAPAILFADEPSGNLDSRTKEDIHNLFFSLREKFGQTIVIVTHDPDLAAMCDRTCVMKDGLFVE